uniref:Protein GLUTAMINE DUMPER 3 n=1 Tax=Aegilops tauschii TaxID=37682 RepID=M8BL98_AEGTA
MRPGAQFLTTSHRAGAPTAAPAHGLINGTAAPHSTWQSPVPYLFGGLAAMLGLIALALLILACSYWKLSGYLDGDRDGQAAGDADEEKGSASGADQAGHGFPGARGGHHGRRRATNVPRQAGHQPGGRGGGWGRGGS